MSRLALRPVPYSLDTDAAKQHFVVSPWEKSGASDDEAWDYTTTLQFRRRVYLEPEPLLQVLDVREGFELRFLTEWDSSLNSKLRGQGSPRRIILEAAEDSVEFIEKVRIPGEQSGGLLTLTSIVTVGDDPGRNTLPGTTIWTDSEVQILESGKSQMSVSLVSFSEYEAHVPDKDARWYIRLENDAFNLPITTAVQVLINSDHEDFSSYFTEEQPEHEKAGELAAQFFSFEIGRELVHRALMDEDFITVDKFDPGTLGASLRVMVATIFGNRDLSELRAMRQRQPAKFEAILQSNLLEV